MMKHIEEVFEQNKPTSSNSPDSTSDDSATNTSRSEQGWLCPICGGTGYLRQDVPVEHPEFGKLVPCQCRLAEQKIANTRKLRAISNLDTMSRFTFDRFLPEGHNLNPTQRSNLVNVFEAARTFAAQPRGWLVILGKYGCGKTHLAVAIAHEVISRGLPAIFVVVPDLLDYLRSAFSPNSVIGYDQRFEEIRSSPLLILDDLGAHSSTPWAQEKLFQLLNYRYNAQLPTVVTSNHQLEEIDPRIRSRLIDPDLVKIVRIIVPDYRRRESDHENSELSSLWLHADQTFDSFKLREGELDREIVENLRRSVDSAYSYAKNPKGWIVFTGTYGCGKTHLAASIATEVVVRGGESALFVVVPDLLDHLRATYNPNSAITYDKRFDEIRKAPFLVLDDLGTESATPWAEEKLYQLFNYRYNANLPTVITIAKDVELKPRLKSLILDVRRCTPIEILAPSYRGRLERIPVKKWPQGRKSPRSRS